MTTPPTRAGRRLLWMGGAGLVAAAFATGVAVATLSQRGDDPPPAPPAASTVTVTGTAAPPAPTGSVPPTPDAGPASTDPPAPTTTSQPAAPGAGLVFVEISDGVPRGLRVVEDDGSIRPLTDGAETSPQWSPDRARVAFFANDPAVFTADPEEFVDYIAGVAVISADGTGLVDLADAATRLAPVSRGSFGFSWSPTGDRLALDLGRSINGPDRGIWVAAADGTQFVELVNDPADFEADPSWSPDGAVVAYSAPDGPRALHVADGTVAELAPGTGSRGAWSPTGETLVSVSFLDEGAELHEVSRHGHLLQRLHRSPGTLTDPAYSPDGARVAFARHDADSTTLVVYDLAAHRTAELVTDSGHLGSLAWSPDGAHLAYVAVGADDVARIYVVPAGGGEPELVAEGGYEPDWGRPPPAPAPADDGLAAALDRDLAAGWQVAARRTVDMDGDGQAEAVLLLSLGDRCTFQAPFVAVYAARDGGWENATAPGNWPGGEPPYWLPLDVPAAVDCEAFQVDFRGTAVRGLVVLDLTGDGDAEVAVLSSAGDCATCDLSVGVLDVRDGRPEMVFEAPSDAIDVPLTIGADGHSLVVEGSARSPDDGRCCPSNRLSYRVVFDDALGRGIMTERSVTPRAGEGTIADAWIVILASLDTAEHTQADAAAIAAEVGGRVLLSDDYRTLNPGYWVVYRGTYPSAADAQAACAALQTDCYHRELGS